MKLKLPLAALAAFMLSLPLQAALPQPVALPPPPSEAVPMAEDQLVEKRMLEISSELRCLVCQNEALSDSRIPLAESLREEVRRLIRAGKSDAEIEEFLVSRYGEFVLFRPRFEPETYVLWVGPFLLLFISLFVLVRFLKQRNAEIVDTPLSDEEMNRAEALLKEARS